MWPCSRGGPGRHHHARASTPSSTPPTPRCSAAAASTAPSTAPPGPELLAECRIARRLRDRRRQGHRRLPAAGPVGDPHRRSGLARRRSRRGRAAGVVLPPVARGRRRARRPSVAFPAISTGVYGYPHATRPPPIAVETVRARRHAGSSGCSLVAFDDETSTATSRLLAHLTERARAETAAQSDRGHGRVRACAAVAAR